MLGIICFPILWTSAQSLGSDVDFQLSQVSVATYCRCGGNLCGVYREFSYESIIGKIILKIGPHFLPKLAYYQTSRGILFNTQCISLF